jgi:tRNA G18 (ribose-2'-O)-methylase SpoU
VTPIDVSDPLDPRLTDYVGLTDSARRMSHEPGLGYFIAEGDQVVRRAAAAGYPPRSVLVSPQRLADLSPEIQALDCEVLVGDYPLLKAVTGFHVHRGVLASFGRLPLRTVDDVLTGARRVVVLEGMNNATNLGAVVRSAAALGMDAVLLTRTCCDPLYRRAVRVSMGEVFEVPYAFLDEWPGALADLAIRGFRVLALTPDPTAVSLRDLSIGPDERVAVLLGAEGPGLTEDAMASSTERVRIPMAGAVDSLNVGAAAAVAFWAVSDRS